MVHDQVIIHGHIMVSLIYSGLGIDKGELNKVNIAL